MSKFPALNVKGARVELVSRERVPMEAEAVAIFNAIRYARREASDSAEEVKEGRVCDMHRTLFYLILSPQGHVQTIWKDRLENIDAAE